jgi:hypothetical protein
MSDNLLREPLCAIGGECGELKADMVEVMERLGTLAMQGASMSRRIDRIAGNAARIKRRLDIVDAPAG